MQQVILARGAALVIAADADLVSGSQSIDLAAEGTAMRAAKPLTSVEPVLDPGFRDRLSQAALKMLAPDTSSVSALPAARRELYKELLAGVVDELKKAAGEDPVVAIFAEAFAPMVAEAFASISSRAISASAHRQVC